MDTIASCKGAATIVAAFATGRGAAYGIGLENKTKVTLDGSQRVESTVNGEFGVGVTLAERAVKRTLAHFGADFTGAKVVTESNIPQAAGLKSSSVAANAIVLSTCAAIAKEKGEITTKRLSKARSDQEIYIDGRLVDAEELINIGIDAAFDAKVTVTGALDDASASYLGGYTLTDNLKRRILYHGGMEESLDVLIFLPEGKIYSADIDVRAVKAFDKEIELIWEQARSGKVYQAITLNGLIHSTCFGLSIKPALKALEMGAIACGLSGTGPAVVALSRDNSKEIKESWEGFDGRILSTKTNNQKAVVG